MKRRMWFVSVGLLGAMVFSLASASESERLVPIATTVDAVERPVTRVGMTGRWYGLVPGSDALVVLDVPERGTQLRLVLTERSGVSELRARVCVGELKVAAGGRFVADTGLDGPRVEADGVRLGTAGHANGRLFLPGESTGRVLHLFLRENGQWLKDTLRMLGEPAR